MRYIFIINPTAGKEDASVNLIPKIKEVFNKTDFEYEIIVSQYKGHTKELALKYAQTGEKIKIYACGGDGTLNEVISGVYNYSNVEVGCIPCGSGMI